MKQVLLLVIVIAVLGINGMLYAQDTPQMRIVDVKKMAIIAFYPPVSQPGEADEDKNEALSDFQFYAEQVKRPLSKAGIDFQELYVRSFRVHFDGKTIVFHPKTEVGYYLVAPGKAPHVEYGVMTDTDLLDVAQRYFGMSAKSFRSRFPFGNDKQKSENPLCSE